MAYSVVLGDLGPVMPLTLTDNGAAFVLDAVNDTVTLRYTDPLGTAHQVTLTITSASTGQCQAAWSNGDLPAVGVYTGMVKVVRAGNSTFPRSFPNDGTKILWAVYETL